MTNLRRLKSTCGQLVLTIALLAAVVSQAGAQSLPFPKPDSAKGTAWSDRLTGDWAGHRADLADNGVTVKAWYVGILQGPVDGGERSRLSFGNKLNLYVALEGEKVGLWKGFRVESRAEARLGDSGSRDLNALLPVSFSLSNPTGKEDAIALPMLKLTQKVNRWLTLTGGRFIAIDGYLTPFADGVGEAEFLHTALTAKPVLSGQMNYSAWTLGAIFALPKSATFKVLLQDPHNVPTTTGFETLAHDGVSMLYEVTFPTNIGKRYGFHTIDVTWSNKDRTSLDRNDAVIVPGGGVVLGVKRNSWSAYYQIGQYLQGDTKRGWGFFGQVSAGDANPNPLAWFVHGGLGGVGSFGRTGDRWGAGYFHVGTSQALRDSLRSVLPLRGEQGLETFYNFGLGRGFHLSPDFQVIRPADGRRGWAAVPGLRLLVEL